MPTEPENSISSSDPYLTLQTLNDVGMMVCEGDREQAISDGYGVYVAFMDELGQLPLGFVIHGEKDGQTITLEETTDESPDDIGAGFICWVQRNSDGDPVGEPIDVSDDEPERWLNRAWLEYKSKQRHPHTLTHTEEDDG